MNAWIHRLPRLIEWLARQPRRQSNSRLPSMRPTLPIKTRPADRCTQLAELRAEALRRMFPKLFSWHASRSEWMVAVEVQEYLAKATNVADLENRIRVVEQQRHFRA